MLSGAASPAVAAASAEEAANAPVIFDVLIMRPIGFATLALGTGLFVVSLPIVAVTKPQQIDEPFRRLVVHPAKFLWVDPLGGH